MLVFFTIKRMLNFFIYFLVKKRIYVYINYSKLGQLLFISP